MITLPAVILYYSRLNGINRQILTPERYDDHPRLFYRGVPLPGFKDLVAHNQLQLQVNMTHLEVLLLALNGKLVNLKLPLSILSDFAAGLHARF